jgi:hypothetical protein
MSTSLGLTEHTPNTGLGRITPEQQLAKAKQVQTMGIIALILLITGFIPILGFFGLLASLIISKKALRMGRDYLVPEQYEKPASWASTISAVFLILSAIGFIFLILQML